MRKLIVPLPLLSIIFFATLSYSILLTVLNVFFLSDTSNFVKDVLFLGCLMALYPLGQFFGSPILLAFSAKWGIKKVLIASLLFSSLLFFLVAMSFSFLLLLPLFILLFLLGMSEGNILLAQKELLHGPLKDEAYLFNHVYTVIAFALVFGPLVSAELIELSLATPFFVLSGILFLLIPLTAYFQKKDPPFEAYHHPKIALKQAFSFFHILRGESKVTYIALFFLYLGIFLFIRSYPIIVIEMFGFNINLLDELISFLSILLIFSGVLVIKPLSQKVPPTKLTILFSLLLGLSYLLMFFPSSTKALWILLILITFLLAIVLTAANALLFEYPHTQRLGSNLLLIFLCEAIACFIGGLLILVYPFLPLFVSALFSFFAALLLLRFEKAATH